MNYLAHALDCLDDPYQTAGAAVPDWLGITRPRLRCRSRHAAPHVDSPRANFAAIARGVVRHHADDDWFHESAAFGTLSMELARRIRAATDDVDGMRPAFLGHILVEMLLDSVLADEDPRRLDAYYEALAAVHPHQVAAAVGEMSGVDAAQLAAIIARFVELRFLYDYARDDLLLMRLNQVMQRVRLPQLPASFADVLPAARQLVRAGRAALLTPPAPTSRRAASVATGA